MKPDSDPNPIAEHTDLNPFFNPRGILVVGASHNPAKLGFGLARNLIQSAYQGAVHFVNPSGGTLLEHPVYRRISEAPDPADLAVLLIPADKVPQALRECGERGTRAAIIASGGFRETGPEGARLENECLAVAREYGIRLTGPNCIGILDTHLPLDTTFLPPPGPPRGEVAFISHSGAICAAVIDWARGQGFGFSRLVSLGNQADLNETDFLSPVADDPFTRVITLYLEGVSDGRRFVAEAARISRQKPIIALKAGRFAGGRQAVASHTGTLAGQESAFEAAFRRAGVIRAKTSEALFDWARALAWCPTPAGPRAAVLTNAGGPGVTAADALEAHGLDLAILQDRTRAALAEILPRAASLQNPIDMLATAAPIHYATCLRHVLADPGVDSVLVILPPPPMDSAGAVAQAMIPIIHLSEKPVVVALMGERLIREAVEHFRAARVPEYRFPEQAAAALAALHQRGAYLNQEREAPPDFQDIDKKTVSRLLAEAGPGEKNFLGQETALAIFSAYHIAAPPQHLACNAEEAVHLAKRIGGPVALKIASPELLHKSDVGGVMLNLRAAAEVREGFEHLVAEVRQAAPEAPICGVYLQPMVPPGQDVIIGIVQDAQFGPLVMFGSGGVEVEGLQDVAFALAPLSRDEAEALLDSTWAGRKLRGFRSIAPADRKQVVETLLRVAQLGVDFPQLAEIEINPLRVLREGEGVQALDIRMRVGKG